MYVFRKEFMVKITQKILRHYILSKHILSRAGYLKYFHENVVVCQILSFSICIKIHRTLPYLYHFSLILPWLSASFYPHIYIFS